MKKNKYDVIVIGAGPAGSICARDLARQKLDVLLVEKRPVVGVPVRCGEGTERRVFLSRYTEIDEKYIETDIHGAIIHTPHQTIKYNHPGLGLMLDRTIFDADLAQQAADAGAELCLDCRVSNVHQVFNSLRKVTIEYENNTHQVEAAMVVAADGVESLCGQWAGIKSRQMAPYTASAIEFILEGKDENPNFMSFWTNYPGIRRGYVWVFPKVKSNRVNIGAGNITPTRKEPNMKEVTEQFKEEFFPNHKLLNIVGGAVPLSGFLEEYVADRFLLAGDAADHTNPLTGGGIASALISGTIAARCIVEGFKQGDLSKNYLKIYQQKCWDRFGKEYRLHKRISDFVFGISPNDNRILFDWVAALVNKDQSLKSKIFTSFSATGMVLRNTKLIRKVIKDTEKPFTYTK